MIGECSTQEPAKPARSVHVRTIFCIVFDSSHFILNVANLVHGSTKPLVWTSVADPTTQTTIELPAHLVGNLNLPNGSNLISRCIVEKREVVKTFQSLGDARQYATKVLGLSLDDEANSSMDIPRDRRPWYLFWKL